MTNQQIAEIVALEALARYLELGGTCPAENEELIAPVENNGTILTLTVRIKKPWLLTEGEVERIKAFLSHTPAAPVKQPTRFTTKEIHDAILKVCTKESQTAKAIARLSGYAYCAHFRTAIRQLTDAGLLVRNSEGLHLP